MCIITRTVSVKSRPGYVIMHQRLSHKAWLDELHPFFTPCITLLGVKVLPSRLGCRPVRSQWSYLFASGSHLLPDSVSSRAVDRRLGYIATPAFRYRGHRLRLTPLVPAGMFDRIVRSWVLRNVSSPTALLEDSLCPRLNATTMLRRPPTTLPTDDDMVGCTGIPVGILS